MGSRSGGPTSRSWGPRSGGSTTCKDENWAPGINHRLGEWVQITPVFLAGNRDDVVPERREVTRANRNKKGPFAPIPLDRPWRYVKWAIRLPVTAYITWGIFPPAKPRGCSLTQVPKSPNQYERRPQSGVQPCPHHGRLLSVPRPLRRMGGIYQDHRSPCHWSGPWPEHRGVSEGHQCWPRESLCSVHEKVR